MLATAAFGSAGFDVVCIDPRSKPSDAAEPKVDTRSTALLLPAKPVLKRAGIWRELRDTATPLRSLKIVDANEKSIVRNAVEFKASEIGCEEFGWNIANRHLKGFLEERINTLPNTSLLTGLAVKRILNRDLEAIAELSDGSRIRAKFVAAADGRNSTIRDHLGIGAFKSNSWQTALAFAVSHRSPHGEMSVEIHESGGPFTLVPLEDIEGSPASAVVWIESWANSDRLLSLSRSDLNARTTKRSCGIFGKLELVSEIGSWPVSSQIATRFSAGRTALIAEAAHVLQPIGAQGLNLSIADINSICRLLDNSDLAKFGFADLLASEGRKRRSKALKRCIGVNSLNLASSWESRAWRSARAFGLAAVGGIEAVRKPLMHFGLDAGIDAAE